MKTDLSDFNLHFLPQFGRVRFLVAGRCFDLAPDRWEALACEWYARHGFSEIKGDAYISGMGYRFKSVDALVSESPLTMSPLGQHLLDSWQVRKKELEKNRIDPAKPVPPPPNTPPIEPEPPSEPSKQQSGDVQQPKRKVPWKLFAAVLAAIAFGLKFTPVPGLVILAIDYLVKILNSVPG